MPSSLPRIAAYIDPELEQQLKTFCKEQGFSTSEAIAYILKHFFGRLPSELQATPFSISHLDDLTKRLEAVEQAISELRSEQINKLPNESREPLGELPGSIPKEREPTRELLSEQPSNQELTESLPSEPPGIVPDPFPKEGLSAEQLADETGVTVEEIDKIRSKGDLANWKGGWRALKMNENEYRYYRLGQALKSRL